MVKDLLLVYGIINEKLIYIEENFISLDECQRFIDLSLQIKKRKLTLIVKTLTQPLLNGKSWLLHYGGDVDPTVPSLDDEVVTRVNSICKNFDSNANLDYVGVVRWPIGTFMKPHVDDNNVHNPDMFAAMLYLNNNFSGGHTCFENFEVKPEPGKLIIFSNSHYLHYVNKVESAERFVLSFWYNSLNK